MYSAGGGARASFGPCRRLWEDFAAKIRISPHFLHTSPLCLLPSLLGDFLAPGEELHRPGRSGAPELLRVRVLRMGICGIFVVRSEFARGSCSCRQAQALGHSRPMRSRGRAGKALRKWRSFHGLLTALRSC